MQLRTIGTHKVSAIGLGGMPMSIEGRPDEARSIATIHAALDAGVTLLDTADSYHVTADEVGHNESLIARALASYGAASASTSSTAPTPQFPTKSRSARCGTSWTRGRSRWLASPTPTPTRFGRPWMS